MAGQSLLLTAKPCLSVLLFRNTAITVLPRGNFKKYLASVGRISHRQHKSTGGYRRLLLPPDIRRSGRGTKIYSCWRRYLLFLRACMKKGKDTISGKEVYMPLMGGCLCFRSDPYLLLPSSRPLHRLGSKFQGQEQHENEGNGIRAGENTRERVEYKCTLHVSSR